MVPYPDPKEPHQRKFNEVHKRLRVKIENCFGLLKGQWRRLLHLNVNSVERAKSIVETCILLHNFNVRFNTGIELVPKRVVYARNAVEIEVNSTPAGMVKRDAIAKAML